MKIQLTETFPGYRENQILIARGVETLPRNGRKTRRWF